MPAKHVIGILLVLAMSAALPTVAASDGYTCVYVIHGDYTPQECVHEAHDHARRDEHRVFHTVLGLPADFLQLFDTHP